MMETTSFANVDLDIYSASDLQPLEAAFGKRAFLLHGAIHKRTYHFHFELTRSRKTPDATIRAFCVLVRALPKAERRLWDRAKRRDFNIGVVAGMQPIGSVFAVEAETVRSVAELNGRILLTVYSPQEPNSIAITTADSTGSE
jgi:hypothetical protein